MKEKILFIGANDMREINGYQDKYKEGLFIEPIPEVFKKLQENLNAVNESNGNNFKALQALITNKDAKMYDFHLYNTKGKDYAASSSIFKMHEVWQDKLGYKETIKLQSKRMSSIISSFDLNIEEYDVFIDVQGAELEVLKSFDDHINKIDWLKTEISTTDIFYKNGVLLNELNSFLNKHGLFTESIPKGSVHTDLVYKRS